MVNFAMTFLRMARSRRSRSRGFASRLSRSRAQASLPISRTKTVENCHRAGHGKFARRQVEGLGASAHHVAVLHARKDMQLHIVLSRCQRTIRAQHLLRSAVIPIAPEDAN